ncbi:hypothetical protein SAY87_026211 [Trapa incisa]|uniref:Pentatricopeptide repeat-containing protein n=1 Tax=Trapa incisa TaxID=236973 RepID=A0AAN7JJS9_9MYRT|nr:hypothetical protein SAY87_026211 [Trapa incisa]
MASLCTPGFSSSSPHPLTLQRVGKIVHTKSVCSFKSEISMSGSAATVSLASSLSPTDGRGREKPRRVAEAEDSQQISGGNIDLEKLKEREARERKEETNRKIASQKALSIILRREATKAVIEKKKGPNNSKKLLPRTVLEALHDRITALRWESALTIFQLLREQLWYQPSPATYVKMIVMLGKCKQPEKADELFQAMVDEGCEPNSESYTALLSAYSRSGLFDTACSLLEQMKSTRGCEPDVHTYAILIKSCFQVFDFNRAQSFLFDMEAQGIKPNTVIYNTLIDAYAKAKMFVEVESIIAEMLQESKCGPDIWTMNSTLRGFGGSGQITIMEKCYEKFQGAGNILNRRVKQAC